MKTEPVKRYEEVDSITDDESTIQYRLDKEGKVVFVSPSVTNYGYSTDELIRKDIFEPFFTTKPKTEGTGLGLWVTHSIVQSHGGIIEVNSQCQKGTSFTVSLPIL